MFITIQTPGYIKKPQPNCEGINKALPIKEWSEDSILELARVYGLKSGFWHFTIDNKEFELKTKPAIETWTKVGIFNSISYTQSERYTTIYVWTEDFDNYTELICVAHNIMDYLDIGTMKYKPTIYSKLGINQKLLEKHNLDNKINPYIAYINEAPSRTKKERNLSWEDCLKILEIEKS